MKLPEHLVERVVANLPLRALCRVRAVCKRWNALPSDPLFCSQYSKGGEEWMVMIDSQGGEPWVYAPADDRWFRLPGCLGTHVNHVQAVGGGQFFCYDGNDAHMCNPVTGDCKLLPKPPKQEQREMTVAGMVVDHEPLRYKVILVQGSKKIKLGWNQFENLIEVDTGLHALAIHEFDSQRNMWSAIASMPPGLLATTAVHCDGKLYFLATGLQQEQVYVYHVAEGHWQSIEFPFISRECCERYFGLVECKGQLLLLGFAWEITRSRVAVKIWSLDYRSANKEIVALSEMPAQVLDQLCPNIAEIDLPKSPTNSVPRWLRLFHCHSIGNRIYLFYHVLEELPATAIMATFDVDAKTWLTQPSIHLTQCFSFIPGLAQYPKG